MDKIIKVAVTLGITQVDGDTIVSVYAGDTSTGRVRKEMRKEHKLPKDWSIDVQDSSITISRDWIMKLCQSEEE